MTTELEDRRLVAEPIMGWKAAALVDVPGVGPRFQPISASGTYGTVEVAECRPVHGVTPGYTMWDQLRALPVGLLAGPVPTHDVPDPDCACGFYARKERADLALSGGRRGQVRLRVALTGTVIAHERGYRAQRQQVVGVEIPKVCGCGDRDHIVGLWVVGPSTYYRPVCRSCAAHAGIEPIALADMTALLGVDVAWCDPTPAWPEITFHFGVSAAQFQQAMTKAMQDLMSAAQLTTYQFNASFGPLFDDPAPEPEHPLDAKRRRDEERRQRLEQLAGPRRAPRNLGRKGHR